MAEEPDGQRGHPTREQGETQLHPAARVVLQAVSLPVAGIVAACVLLAMGVALIFVALVLVAALVAGAASLPLAALAGRRRIDHGRSHERQVLDAAARTRHPDAEDGDEDGGTPGRAR